MAYSLSAGTDEGKVRVLIQDVTSVAVPVIFVDYYFEDVEITALLDLNESDVWAAAADCAFALAARFAKEAIIIGLGKQDIYIDKKKKSEYFLTLGKTLQSKSAGGITEFVDSFNYNVDIYGNDLTEYIGDR